MLTEVENLLISYISSKTPPDPSFPYTYKHDATCCLTAEEHII